MLGKFSAAVIQFRIDMGDPEKNEKRAFALLRKAAGMGASLAVMPEMWSTGFAYGNLARLARTTPEILARLSAFSSQKKMVVAGSLPESVGKGVFNTFYVIDTDGSVAGEYRKAHLFRPSGEHLHFRRGAGSTVISTSLGKIGPLICYDLRFPELSRKYFLEGADIICVSAQWPSARKEHWELLSRARAVENQLFVLSSNAVERSGDFVFAGGSAIVSPWGNTLASCGEKEGIALAAIDGDQVENIRRKIPCARDRNIRAYRPTPRKK